MVDREAFLTAYEAAGRNKQKTADALGVARSTIHYYALKYGGHARPAKYCDATIAAAMERLGNKAAVARELNMPRASVQHSLARVAKQVGEKPVATGRIDPVLQTLSMDKPRRGKIARYIVTSAQNNSLLHEGFWENLLALAKHYKARVLVSRYTYNKNGFAANTQKPDTEEDSEGMWYPDQIMPYICDERVRLAPDLVFCGELNILPTAVRPLSGLETYTGSDACIVPHAKLAKMSVPGSEQGKLVYTTGTVTQRNYLQRKAGQKAEFHHAYAALLVEVDDEGDWFVRQLNASDNGTFHDLDIEVSKGKIKTGVPIAGAVFGDIHVDRLEKEIRFAIWGKGGLVDTLRPDIQVMHDTFDHQRRNHHDKGNPHLEFKKHMSGLTDVRGELTGAGRFLAYADRPFSAVVVVASNHDKAFEKWLREADFKTDPTNAKLFLEGNLAVYDAIEKGKEFYAPEWGMRLSGDCPDGVTFLRPDESFLLNGIELGMHGDKGPNGLRGSPQALMRLGRKAVIGHSHSSAIMDGLYVVGVTGSLRMGYNVGPSSWSRTHCLIYKNGKRTLITMRGNKWRA